MMIGNQIEINKFMVHHTPGIADLLIVHKAMESAAMVNTELVGDGTVLLILMYYHTRLDSSSTLFFWP